MKSRLLSFIKLLAPWVATLLVLLLSDPTKLPSAVLIVPFILLFISIYITVKEVMHLLRGGSQDKTGTETVRARIIAGLIACFPVLLLVLQSIGQLTTWDVLTAIALFVITYFYVIKSSVVFPGR